MAITVNGQILRNLPEQVSKNTEDIIDLQDVSENYGIRITALEGNAIALATFQDCTFTGTTAIKGDVVQTVGNASFANDVSVGGALTVTGNASLANASASGNLAVTGDITGGSIIENMSGYGLTMGTSAYATIEGVYAGIVKNGNKLSFALSLNITKTSSYAYVVQLAYFSLPANIANKLVPNFLDSATMLMALEAQAFPSDYQKVSVDIGVAKSGNGFNVYLLSNQLNALTANTEYNLRIEGTFLLSQNLI